MGLPGSFLERHDFGRLAGVVTQMIAARGLAGLQVLGEGLQKCAQGRSGDPEAEFERLFPNGRFAR